MLDWVTTAIAFLSLSVSIGTKFSRPTRLTQSLGNLRALQEIRRADPEAVSKRRVQLAVDEARGNLALYQKRYGPWEVGIPYAVGLTAYLSFLLWVMEGDDGSRMMWWQPLLGVAIAAIAMAATIRVIEWLQRRSRQTAESARPGIEGREEDKLLAPGIPSGNSAAGSHGHD